MQNRTLHTSAELLSSLPIKRGLTPIYAISATTAILVAAASIAGLTYRTAIYPTDELLRAFVSNDVVNLLVGLPVLIGSMGLAWRGRLVGLLCWPGALLFVLYNYIAYVIALPFGAAFPLHLALVMLSAYTFVDLVTSIDGKAVRESLSGIVPERAAGGVLAGLGFLFFLRAIGVIVNALVNGAVIAKAELAVNVSDLLISPAWVVGGVLLWRRREIGYVIGLGLLLGISMLFIALIVFLILQPLLTNAPFALADVVMISAMSLICFIPLCLFLRGVVSKQGP
jgi:hypothetical protein